MARAFYDYVTISLNAVEGSLLPSAHQILRGVKHLPIGRLG
jgi:hypothetical protein